MQIRRLTEYYADCSADGQPTILLLDLEVTVRNHNFGSPIAFSVQQSYNKTTYSPASLRRMNLNGKIVKLSSEDSIKEASKCYLSKHPDAVEWIPGQKDAPHHGSWYRFQVESVYYFGGRIWSDDSC